MSQSGPNPSMAPKNPRNIQIVVRGSTLSRGLSSPHQVEIVANQLNDTEEEEKTLVVYQVGQMTVSKQEPKNQTTFL